VSDLQWGEKHLTWKTLDILDGGGRPVDLNGYDFERIEIRNRTNVTVVLLYGRSKHGLSPGSEGCYRPQDGELRDADPLPFEEDAEEEDEGEDEEEDAEEEG